MATPLGGVSDGRGILSLLTGFAKGYQGAKQMQYQRQMAQAQMQMANDYKMGQLGVQQQRVDAYGRNIDNMEGYHEGQLGNARDRNLERYDAMLASGALTPEGYAALTGFVPGGRNSGGAADTPQAFPGDAQAPAGGDAVQGFPGDAPTPAPVAQTPLLPVQAPAQGGIVGLMAPKAPPVNFMGPATAAKIANTTAGTNLKNSQVEVNGARVPLLQSQTKLNTDYKPGLIQSQTDKNKADATYTRGPKTADTQANTKYTAGAKTSETNARAGLTTAQTKEVAPNAQSLRQFRKDAAAAAGVNAAAHAAGVDNQFILGMGRNGIAQQNADTAAGKAAGQSGGVSGYGSQFDKMTKRRGDIQKRLTELSTSGVRYDPSKSQFVTTQAPIAVPGAVDAQQEYARLKAEDKDLNNKQWTLKQQAGQRPAGGFVGARPNDDGQPGCADSVCLMARQAGLPVPNTRSAADMESRLGSYGWVPIDAASARAGDIIAMPGTGPSKRHVGMVADGGYWLNDPGKRSHNTIVREPMPTGAGVKVYRYQGKKGN